MSNDDTKKDNPCTALVLWSPPGGGTDDLVPTNLTHLADALCGRALGTITVLHANPVQERLEKAAAEGEDRLEACKQTALVQELLHRQIMVAHHWAALETGLRTMLRMIQVETSATGEGHGALAPYWKEINGQLKDLASQRRHLKETTSKLKATIPRYVEAVVAAQDWDT